MIGTIAMIVIVLMIMGIHTILVGHVYEFKHVYPVRIDDAVVVRDNEYVTTWENTRIIKVDGRSVEEDETVLILVR
jgi:hypothetical protein